jgi:hypothetical protein
MKHYTHNIRDAVWDSFYYNVEETNICDSIETFVRDPVEDVICNNIRYEIVGFIWDWQHSYIFKYNYNNIQQYKDNL